MGARRKGFSIAGLVAIADIWVTAYSGPAIWQVWSGTPLCRIGILVLAGAASFSLADIWRKTLAIPPLSCPAQQSDALSLADRLPGEVMEGADV
jgi:hypothetical protein